MRRSLFPLAGALALAACTVGPDHAAPTTDLPVSWSLPGGAAMPRADWWTAFGDPTLDDLVRRAQAASPTVGQAEAALRAARAVLAGTAAAGGAQLDGGASATRQRLPGNGPTARSASVLQAGLDASWEIDLFGGRRRAVEASAASAQASAEALAAARLALAGDVVQGYASVRGLQARIAVARGAAADRRRALDLARNRLQAGAGSGIDAAQAEVDVATADAALPPLEEELALARHSLAVLTGAAPAALDGLLAEARPVPQAPLPATGVPADLLRRRPDVRQAERELARATAEIGVAVADLYPRLTLGGTLTLSGSSLSGALGGPPGFGIGPSLSVPLFDSGARRANVQAREALATQASEAWRAAVLAALKDVEDALASCDREAAHLKALRTSVARSEQLVGIARQRYAGGVGDFLSVLDAQRGLSSARDLAVRSETALAVASARLHKALGGGWDAPAP